MPSLVENKMAVSTGSLKIDVEKYKCDSNDAIFIKLVRTEQDVVKDNENVMHPWMSHQVFGDSETIFGYKDLKIKLYYHAGSLLAYLSMSCQEKVPSSLGVNPDPILPNIAEKLPEGFYSNLDEFIAKFPEENNFIPMGNKIHSYSRGDIEYEIYQADISTLRLREYHERIQTFILWYIDAASFIEIDDGRWNFFLLFQMKKWYGAGPLLREYSFVGYLTAYHYYAYPNKYRPRISQMLILPPYQKVGHGVELLQSVNQYYISKSDATDITVEDPSEEFARCRDFIDCKNCLKLDEFKKENLLKGYSKEMKTSALKNYKMNTQQIRRVYEILRLQCTDTSDKNMYQDYRLDVKNRLNIPYQKQARDMKKLQSVLSTDEFNAAMIGNAFEERIQRLEEAYKLLEDEYKKVIERLAII